jgi:putative membrane protein
MIIRRISMMLGTLLLAGLACAAFAQSSSSTPGTGGSMSKSGTSKDAMFMHHAAADSLAEIQMGRIALDKSSSAQVKELAQRIIDDHTKANDQLMSIAERQQVTLPTEPTSMQKQEADKLKAMSGTAFDRAYAKAMVKDHRKAIKMFGMESQKASDNDVKQFASATLPVLKTHMEMAEKLAGSEGMHGGTHSKSHTTTPMDSNGSMSMPPSGSSTH